MHCSVVGEGPSDPSRLGNLRHCKIGLTMITPSGGQDQQPLQLRSSIDNLFHWQEMHSMWPGRLSHTLRHSNIRVWTHLTNKTNKESIQVHARNTSFSAISGQIQLLAISPDAQCSQLLWHAAYTYGVFDHDLLAPAIAFLRVHRKAGMLESLLTLNGFSSISSAKCTNSGSSPPAVFPPVFMSHSKLAL